MVTTNASEIANLNRYQSVTDDASVVWLEKAQSGKVSLEDIKEALAEFTKLFNAGMASKAEILTLARAFPDSPSYTDAARKQSEQGDDHEPLVIGGPASVSLVDREGHLITTGALKRAFQKFMNNDRTRNVMVLHSDVQVGWALPAYISKGGQIFKSGVDDKGLFFICELRDDTSIAAKVADQIKKGQLKSYSIAGSATSVKNITKGLTPYLQVDDMELAEVTVCEKGVNQGASFEILKAEQSPFQSYAAKFIRKPEPEAKPEPQWAGPDNPPGGLGRHAQTPLKDKMIMHSNDDGTINFNKSFAYWMQKEKDPLTSKESFVTLNNEEGRQAEHAQLLREYGFPSAQPIEAMRYVPVVETETDDDGIPIHNLPPWVVNEAGEALGDRLDEDSPGYKKSDKAKARQKAGSAQKMFIDFMEKKITSPGAVSGGSSNISATDKPAGGVRFGNPAKGIKTTNTTGGTSGDMEMMEKAPWDSLRRAYRSFRDDPAVSRNPDTGNWQRGAARTKLPRGYLDQAANPPSSELSRNHPARHRTGVQRPQPSGEMTRPRGEGTSPRPTGSQGTVAQQTRRHARNLQERADNPIGAGRNPGRGYRSSGPDLGLSPEAQATLDSERQQDLGRSRGPSDYNTPPRKPGLLTRMGRQFQRGRDRLEEANQASGQLGGGSLRSRPSALLGPMADKVRGAAGKVRRGYRKLNERTGNLDRGARQFGGGLTGSRSRGSTGAFKAGRGLRRVGQGMKQGYGDINPQTGRFNPTRSLKTMREMKRKPSVASEVGRVFGQTGRKVTQAATGAGRGLVGADASGQGGEAGGHGYRGGRRVAGAINRTARGVAGGIRGLVPGQAGRTLREEGSDLGRAGAAGQAIGSRGRAVAAEGMKNVGGAGKEAYDLSRRAAPHIGRATSATARFLGEHAPGVGGGARRGREERADLAGAHRDMGWAEGRTVSHPALRGMSHAEQRGKTNEMLSAGRGQKTLGDYMMMHEHLLRHNETGEKVAHMSFTPPKGMDMNTPMDAHGFAQIAHPDAGHIQYSGAGQYQNHSGIHAHVNNVLQGMTDAGSMPNHIEHQPQAVDSRGPTSQQPNIPLLIPNPAHPANAGGMTGAPAAGPSPTEEAGRPPAGGWGAAAGKYPTGYDKQGVLPMAMSLDKMLSKAFRSKPRRYSKTWGA